MFHRPPPSRFALLIMLIGQATPAFAQGGVGGVGGVGDVGGGGNTDDGGFAGLDVPAPPENLSLAWQLRKRLLAKGDAETAAKKLEEIEELRIDLGAIDLSRFAQALLAEANDLVAAPKAGEDGKAKPGKRGSPHVRTAQALALAQAAERIAPRLPDPHFAQARFHRLAGPDIGAMASQVAKGVRKSFRHPLRLAWLGGEAALRAIVALLLTLSLFLVFQWFRYAGGMRHDLGDLMPSGMSPRQAGFVLAVLAVTPILAGLPFAAVLAIWLIAPFGYQRFGERVLSLLAVAVVATLPLTLPTFDRALHLRGGVGQALYNASYEFPTDATHAELVAAVKKDPKDLWPLHGLALIQKRQGKLYKAEEWLQAALLVAGSGSKDRGALLVNLGAVQVARNRIKEAESSYDEAIQVDPRLGSAHYGLAKVLQIKGDEDDQVQASTHYALTVDEARIEAFQQHQSDGLNRFVLDEPIPASAVFARMFRDPPPPALGPAILPALLGGTPESRLPLGGAAMLLGLLVFWALSSRLNLATHCVKCGGPVCTRCHEGIGRTGHCHDCYLAFHRTERILPQDRQRQELAVRRYKVRRRSASLLLTLVATGSGHMLSGRALRGGVFLFAFFVFCSFMAAWQGVIRPEMPAAPGFPVAGLGSAGLLFLVIYVLAILDIRVEERT